MEAQARNSLSTASILETTLLRNRGNVPGTVQNTDDHHSVRDRTIVDGIGAVERHSQTGAELFARGLRQGEMPHWLKGGLDRGDKSGGDVF
jgi:hypothetical protein